MMEVWQTITAAILSNALVLAVLGWLIKSFLEKLMQRDSKRFEFELKAKADAAIEQLKSDLQRRAIEHQVRFARLHEKQATVIAELNGLLAEAMWNAESFLHLMEWTGERSKQEKYVLANDKLVDLFHFFDKNRIYLSEAQCNLVEKLIHDLRVHVVQFAVYLKYDDSSAPEHTVEKKYEAWEKGFEAVKHQVPAVRKKLEDEFRAILGLRTDAQ
jgi:hypothetical protein